MISPLGALLTALLSPAVPAEHLVVPDYDLQGVETTVASGFEETIASLKAQFNPNLDAAGRSQLYGALGQLLHAYDLRSQALASYERAQWLKPDDGRWPYLLAVVAAEDGNHDSALTALRQTLAAQPDYLAATVRLAALLRDGGQFEAAELVISRLAVDAEAPPASLAALAEHYLATERPQQAIELLLLAAEQVPEATRLNYLLGQAYRAAGERKTARQYLAKSGDVGLAHADPWLDEVKTLARGEVLALQTGQRAFNAGDYPGAVKAFEKAVAAEPQSVRALINLAAALGEAGDPDGAIDKLVQVLELAPENETALFNLAALLVARGELERADGLYQRLLKLNPNDMQAHLLRARLLRQAGLPAVAVAHASRARSSIETYQPAVMLETELLIELGQLDDALTLLNDAHAIFPADPTIALTRANLLATVPAPLGNPREALALAEQVQQHAPSGASAEAIALALAALNRCAESARWLQKSAAMGSVQDQERLLSMAKRIGGQENCQP